MTHDRNIQRLASISDDQGNSSFVEVIYTLDSKLIKVRLREAVGHYQPHPGRVATLTVSGRTQRVGVLQQVPDSLPGVITFLAVLLASGE